jgi:hypothetical protein
MKPKPPNKENARNMGPPPMYFTFQETYRHKKMLHNPTSEGFAL